MLKPKSMSTLLVAVLTSSLFLSGCTQSTNLYQHSSVDTVSYQLKNQQKLQTVNNDKTYLQSYFNVKFDDAINLNNINDTLQKVFKNDAVLVKEPLNGINFIKALTQSARFDELALTYDDNKVKAALRKNKITDSSINSNDAKYVAVALDTGILNQLTVKTLLSSKQLNQELVTKSLMETIEHIGLGRNYLGYSNDANIYQKIENSWQTFAFFDGTELSNFGNRLVKNEITTGYNLTSKAHESRFIANQTITYGHSDIKHAFQLIGLLNSEDIVARVQIVPKVSVFKYLLEWGDINEATPFYRVIKSDNQYLANALEYDLELEFASQTDMNKFVQLIDQYAKRNKENQGKGLIYQSWWQPFLVTVNNDMPKDQFFTVHSAEASNDRFTLRMIILEKDKDKVQKELKKLNKKIATSIKSANTNLAFYNYLQGIDYE